MGSRGTNDSLQTAPLYPTPSAEGEASLQDATSSAGEKVLVPSTRQASQAVLQLAGPTTSGVSPVSSHRCRSAVHRGSWFLACARDDRHSDRGGEVRGPQRFTGGEFAIAAKGF